MTLLSIDTPIGPLKALNLQAAGQTVAETIFGDCYRLKRLAAVFRPVLIHDMGVYVGDVTMFARHLWPEAKIVGFEESGHFIEIAQANVPDAVFKHCRIGYAVTGPDAVSIYGHPDLLKIDVEGGEVPFFYSLYRYGGLQGYRVIVGEWHGRPAYDLLKTILSPDFETSFLGSPSDACGLFFAVRKGEDPSIAKALLS